MANNNTKKLLIITYYWPPAGGPGVQRWLKFVKYLPDFDVQPIVYVPENPTYQIVDSNLVSEVSDKAIILKTPIFLVLNRNDLNNFYTKLSNQMCKHKHHFCLLMM